jgi:glycosyltransferase involved in cell wall biosynthesis
MGLDNVYVIIAAYNEEKRIHKTITDVKQYIPADRIIVVDDGSSDKTYEEARLALDGEILPVKHKVNLGKGEAIKTGIETAKCRNAKAVILMDADGQHDSSHLTEFIKELQSHDVVFGCRAFDKTKMPLVARFGNIILNLCSRFILGVRINDVLSGYRAINLRVYEYVRTFTPRYNVEIEQIYNVGKHKLDYTEITIKTIYLDKNKGTTVLDGLKILWHMIKMKLFGP